MTEAEWLACTEPEAMLTFLRNHAVKPGCLTCKCCRVGCRQQVGFCPAYRKLRLFACACCHRILHLLPAAVCQEAVRALERYIEGVIDEESYLDAYREFDRTRRSRFPKWPHTPDDGAWNALYCAVHRKWLERFDEELAEDRWRIATVIARDAASSAEANENGTQSDLLRDVVGNPFRPSPLDPTVLTWNGGTVPRMAQAIYDGRTFDQLPILADALEEAGCTNLDILAHCRQPGVHVRGCWVIDLLLGKE